jgi:pimeloyl-ACP methyl ester carboxylesterase
VKRVPPFFVLLVLAFVAGCGGDSPTDEGSTPIPNVIRTEAVGFSTADGFAINGTWYTSDRQQGRLPVLILLHMFGGTHGQWLPFIPELVGNGYAVLAFDLRGHGQSAYRNEEYSPRTLFEVEDFDRMPLDVAAALAWIGTRSEADANRIGLIGADIGAKIAFISAGTLAGIKTTVSLSPSYREGQEILLPEGIPGFQPRSVLFLAAFGDGYAFTSAEAMAQLTLAPALVKGYQGDDHGLSLLSEATIRAEIYRWLRENL